MKKTITLVLALIMMLAVASTALAASVDFKMVLPTGPTRQRRITIRLHGRLRLRPQALAIREFPAIGSMARPCVSEQGSTIM